MEVLNICSNEEKLTVRINGEEKIFGLLRTNIPYVKTFYLGYYTGAMFINLKTNAINSSIFKVWDYKSLILRWNEQ